jgi:hypothetical protein
VGFAPEPKRVVLRDIVPDRDILGGLPFYRLGGQCGCADDHIIFGKRAHQPWAVTSSSERM